MRKVEALVLSALLAVMLFAALLLGPFGSPAGTRMDDYFISHGQEETGSNNIVTAVVFDYRGMDTLGEASVLFAAATGVFLVLRKTNDGKDKERDGQKRG